VDEVRRRVDSISSEYITGTEMLDQFIDEPRFSLIPYTLTTERPDRFASHLADGYVGIIADHSPFAAIVPGTIMSYVNHPEDFYIRWPYGAFIRLLRIVGAVFAMLVSATYVAAINYHPEMLPSNLLLTIAATREAVPIPLVIEVVGAEVAFDFIREAGVRVPSPMGPTIGIVGALLVGEAAVKASLLTPEVVIIAAISGIALFAVPNQEAAFVIRLTRFAYIFAASIMGFVGLATALYLKLLYLCSIRNFGVPFMAPFAPKSAAGFDLLVRGPLWRMEERPGFLRPEKTLRQPPVARRWLFRLPGFRKATMTAGLRRKAGRRGPRGNA
jgi:spore germination protein KA